MSTKTNKTTKHQPFIVAIVGATSSGKTALSLELARKFKGEIINADARQMYQKFDIGTGKPPGRRGKYLGHNAFLVKAPYEEMIENGYMNKEEEVPHYLMDFLKPDKIMSVAEWREKAYKAIKGVVRRGHLPIVVGGTGLYVTALIENFSIPEVPPNEGLRKSFQDKPLPGLVDHLLRLDPSAGNMVDLKNPRRVIRAIEMCTFTGKPVAALKTKRKPVVDALSIGIRHSREMMHKRIDESIDRMIAAGWPEELRRLRDQGIQKDMPAMTSIGYKELCRYLNGEILLEEAIKLIKFATHQYAKRQETWFKRDKTIHWVKSEEEAEGLIKPLITNYEIT